MNVSQLLQKITNSKFHDNFVNIENENHDINIWYSKSVTKWVLEFDGMIIKDAKHCITLIDKLANMNLINPKRTFNPKN
tara:strand:- start:6505 stop:6741 length:237 start_codon:yes stop_codon:yes gene_type:complete